MNSNATKQSVSFLILGAVFFLFPGITYAATNLISNPGFETANSTAPSKPQGWISGRWGTNTTTFTYHAAGANGTKGAQVTISTYTSGDAKWTIASSISIKPNTSYDYSDSYTSTVPTFVTLEFALSDGTFKYVDIATPGASTSWKSETLHFTSPTNAVSMRIFHLINRVGTLTLDDVSLSESPIATDPNNAIQNPSFENVNANRLPINWSKGRWGTNTTSFNFPVAGFDGANGAEVSISSWSSGDAKWYFNEVPVSGGTPYEFSDYSKGTAISYITVAFHQSNGSYTYLDLGTVPATSSWTKTTKTFTVPAGTVALTIYHLIKSVGTLDVDMYSLKKIAVDPTKFDKGYVSINFDDGILSTYQNALPILDQAGFKSDDFIITGRMNAQFPGYVSKDNVLNMYNRGHEVGAHTRTHIDLTATSSQVAQSEIVGSKNDLLALGITPVDFFAYPYGGYNSTIEQMVKNAGFKAARSSDGGYNDKTQDIYALRRMSMDNTTTFDQVKGYIDNATMNKTWVILLFHEVNNTGDQYSVTPALFQQIVDYLKQKNITPITLHQGIQLINQ